MFPLPRLRAQPPHRGTAAAEEWLDGEAVEAAEPEVALLQCRCLPGRRSMRLKIVERVIEGRRSDLSQEGLSARPGPLSLPGHLLQRYI